MRPVQQRGTETIEGLFQAEYVGMVSQIDPARSLNDWTRALGDEQYNASSFLLDIRDGQITFLTHNIETPVSLVPMHTFDVFNYWVTFVNDSGAPPAELRQSGDIPFRTAEATSVMEPLAPVFLDWLNETWTCSRSLRSKPRRRRVRKSVTRRVSVVR